MPYQLGTRHLRAQPATWRGHLSTGTKNFSPQLPSGLTEAERGAKHMQNSSKRLLRVSRQKPEKRNRHPRRREPLERFSRQDTSVNPGQSPTAIQLSALRTLFSLTLASIFTTESAHLTGPWSSKTKTASGMSTQSQLPRRYSAMDSMKKKHRLAI